LIYSKPDTTSCTCTVNLEIQLNTFKYIYVYIHVFSRLTFRPLRTEVTYM